MKNSTCVWGGSVLPHVLHERLELRHHVDHQKEGGRHDDGADKGGIHDDLLGVRGQFVFPLQCFHDALQHFGELPGGFAGTHQTDENLIEYRAVTGHGVGKVLATFDRLDHACDHLTEARVFDAVAQVGKSFEDRHTRTCQLFQVEAEGDQLPARHLAGAKQAAIGDGLAVDQIQFHALEAHFEVDRY
jgi:hypothetical protein